MLPQYSSLSESLREAVLSDFVGLVRSEMYVEAAAVSESAGRLFRYVLFSRLRDVPIQKRQTFAALLYQKNLDDAPIPGVDRRPARPWR